MPKLGVSVLTSSAPPATGPLVNTGQEFLVGFADEGPVGTAVKVTSTSAFTNIFGARSATSNSLYDWLDDFFHEGGNSVYISREVGPAPVNAVAANLVDTEGTPKPVITVSAQNPGVYANGWTVSVVNTAGAYVITIKDANGNVLETSPSIATLAALPTWAPQYVTAVIYTGAGFGNASPASVANVALAGGTDDRVDATITQFNAALAVFSRQLGAGQVSAPGQSSPTIAAALFQHAEAKNRHALADLGNVTESAAATFVTAFLAALVTAGDLTASAYGELLTSNIYIPGIAATGGAARLVPASATVAAFCARVDATGNPNQAAAGMNYQLQYGYALDNEYVEADRQSLFALGVNTFKTVFGSLINYGFATPDVSDPIYNQANASRCRMAIVADCDVVAENYAFAQIDGAGTVFTAFGGALSAVLSDFYGVGALYGPTPAAAFSVYTGPNANTVTTIADGEIHAVISVRLSPAATYIEIDVVSVPTSVAV